ncbi:uncharacterized protein [Musca autumnalis]|uniref:uncharacterized protein n=1 Tax=Musca autumnalis TaxID=221902 RepID=UPI003CF54998
MALENLEGYDLADPNFHSPSHVDLLLGSNVIPSLLLDGVRKIGSSLVIQATIFGWVISGSVPTQTVSSFSIETSEDHDASLSQQLRKFWEQEEIPEKRLLSASDEYCESLFKKTTVRTTDGRYMVRLPFRRNYEVETPITPSRNQALIQYIRMEQSLKNKPEMAKVYNGVLQEYISLHHMETTISTESLTNGSCNSFYLPQCSS